ncbi:carboxymuconolactone decarboxylase family protein [Afifella sp. IM 167]|uniref:carboxymuconolactone decarboxylase family protein n=1 Tax=Afifella sp. IM 167 TaxID=2033586 RepID=UPI001CCAB5F6|nr:carboxymuconolactone decarboxylase family protein [Afifella sp. IM 167]MBZ8133740.1 4-carboxymuconolactone decarboxylase [Afifella sp. IM 167]
MSGRETIALPDLDNLTPEQQKIADAVAAGPRGVVRGPVRAWLHSPELADIAQRLGEFLRWRTVIGQRIAELVILTTARHYSCHYIWFNHLPMALKAGLDPQIAEAIKNRNAPDFAREEEAVAYRFAREALAGERVSDATLKKAKALFSERGVVEMGALIAHYHSGAIVLSLADIDLPDGTKTCLP